MLRVTTGQRSPYTGGMFRAGAILVAALALAACGMKGDLYLPPEAPAESTELPVPVESDQTDQSDKGEQRTIPSTPDPSLSR